MPSPSPTVKRNKKQRQQKRRLSPKRKPSPKQKQHPQPQQRPQQRRQLVVPKEYTLTTTHFTNKKRHLDTSGDGKAKKTEITEIIKEQTTRTETYPTAPIPPAMNRKLQRLDKRRGVTTFEIAPGTGDNKSRILTQIIGGYVVRYIRPMARIYHCSFVKDRTKALYRYKIADIGDTVGNIIKKLQDVGIRVYLHGGIVRDMFLGVRSADIDIIFDSHLGPIKELCQSNNWPCSNFDERNQYVNFGEDKGISLEGSNLSSVFMSMPHNREASVNDLVVDLQTGLLIDISGYGLQDVLDRRLRLSPLPKYWERWAEVQGGWKRPLRYFKLIQKGFKPMNQATHSFITNYIKDNWERVYERPVAPPIYMTRRIKHFLIKTMTQGTIDTETGDYEFGPTEDKLIPYLKILRLHLGKDIFNRAVAQFTDEDIAMLQDASVVSDLRSYKAAQRSSDLEPIARRRYKARIAKTKKQRQTARPSPGKTKKQRS